MNEINQPTFNLPMVDLDRREDIIQLLKTDEWMTHLKNKLLGRTFTPVHDNQGNIIEIKIEEKNSLMNEEGAENIINILSLIDSPQFKLGNLKEHQFYQNLELILDEVSETLFLNYEKYNIDENKLSFISQFIKSFIFAVLSHPLGAKSMSDKELIGIARNESIVRREGEQGNNMRVDNSTNKPKGGLLNRLIP